VGNALQLVQWLGRICFNAEEIFRSLASILVLDVEHRWMDLDLAAVLELLRLWRSVGSAVCGLQELGLRSVLNYRLQ